jgi:hypothetical protein
MARLRKPLLPDGPVRLYFERLHAMHLAAGEPSVRQLQRATRSAQRPAGINATTIHDTFVKPRLRQWEVVHEIARQLDGDLHELFRLWRQAREVQLKDPDPAVGRDQNRLRPTDTRSYI